MSLIPPQQESSHADKESAARDDHSEAAVEVAATATHTKTINAANGRAAATRIQAETSPGVLTEDQYQGLDVSLNTLEQKGFKVARLDWEPASWAPDHKVPTRFEIWSPTILVRPGMQADHSKDSQTFYYDCSNVLSGVHTLLGKAEYMENVPVEDKRSTAGDTREAQWAEWIEKLTEEGGGKSNRLGHMLKMAVRPTSVGTLSWRLDASKDQYLGHSRVGQLDIGSGLSDSAIESIASHVIPTLISCLESSDTYESFKRGVETLDEGIVMGLARARLQKAMSFVEGGSVHQLYEWLKERLLDSSHVLSAYAGTNEGNPSFFTFLGGI